MPLFQLSKTQEVLVPSKNNETGEWSLKTPYIDGAEFIATCSGDGNHLKYFKEGSITARCDIHGNIQTKYGIVTLDRLICLKQTVQTIVQNGTCPWCPGTKYTITPANYDTSSGYVDGQIHCCFNEYDLSTYNVRHYIDGKNLANSVSVSRPSFQSAGMYPNIDVNKCYTKAVQVITFEQILGSSDPTITCVDTTKSDVYLARGHLGAMADFPSVEGKLATFYFCNATPQWQCLNAGNWLRAESDLRDWASLNYCSLEVTTGVSGVLELKDVNGIDRKLYLGRDQDTDAMLDKVPVPRRTIKMVYSPEKNCGIVIIQENNPCGTFTEQDHICDDITDQLDWPTWNKDVTKGYTYSCALSTFKLEYFPSYPNATVMM
ncbi:unnamed protein product [Allacma fusca]|uniref:DNA/RNA non-specific endonuclease/pyrophosphatase/phosphodiesterase domain-containing protein n=1 Tax=Allacma fusca TaxID=39272 RepID=A0A8J2LT18_9HEXA|nr:unnamed protein product [Allacma fusca]